MENISCSAELQNAIKLLEAEQADRLDLMIESFHQASTSLNPVRLIENTLKKVSTSPYLANNLLSAATGLAAGYISKKAITGGVNNKLIRLLGVFLQFGITNIVAQNPKAIRSLVQNISHHIFHKEK